MRMALSSAGGEHGHRVAVADRVAVTRWAWMSSASSASESAEDLAQRLVVARACGNERAIKALQLALEPVVRHPRLRQARPPRNSSQVLGHGQRARVRGIAHELHAVERVGLVGRRRAVDDHHGTARRGTPASSRAARARIEEVVEREARGDDA